MKGTASRIFIALAVMCMNIPLPLFAQQAAADSVVDLKAALVLARQNYPLIRAKLAERESAVYELKATRNSYLPAFTVQGQIMDATSNQVRGTFFPNEGTAIPVSGGIKANGYTNDAVWTSFATALVNWKFFTFGKYRASVDEAKAGITAAEADYRNEVFQHEVRVTDAYIAALMFDNMVQSQRANLARVKALREVTAAYAIAGLRPGVDSSLVNAEYSKAMLLFLEANRLAKEQHVYLKELLGVDSTGYIVLDTVEMASLPPLIRTDKGFSDNPRLTLLRSTVNLEQSRINSIKRRELPSVSLLAAGWGRGSGIADKLSPNGDFLYNTSFSAGVPFRAYNYMVGVSTIWNITSLFKTTHEVKRQRSIAKMTQEHYNAETLKLESEWQRARLRYQAALEVARQAPVQLRAAQDAYSQAKARYSSGLSTILELTQTFAVLNRSEVDASVATANVWRAVLQYAAATGDFDVFINNFH